MTNPNPDDPAPPPSGTAPWLAAAVAIGFMSVIILPTEVLFAISLGAIMHMPELGWLAGAAFLLPTLWWLLGPCRRTALRAEREIRGQATPRPARPQPGPASSPPDAPAA